MVNLFHIGIDVGSTTVKIAVLNKNNEVVYSVYKRHFSDVLKSVKEVLCNFYEKFGDNDTTIAITGSGGIGIANKIGVKFIQEVISSTKAINYYHPETDVAIELGGEDAKVTFLKNGVDQRMNGICAGGTGAFIDQMASLLKTDAKGLNELAKDYEVIYPIASRCGVFAKTDIQPLINDGARQTDLAMSIFNAVVVQTVSVLSCGRKIEGKVAFLGGPLYFLSELREAFKRVLKLKDEDVIFPENAQLYVALGASLLSAEEKSFRLSSLVNKLGGISSFETIDTEHVGILFNDESEYEEFKSRHDKDKVNTVDINDYKGNCFLGIDAGSTTTKLALVDEQGNLLYSHYGSNQGAPLETTIDALRHIYSILPDVCRIVYATVTGYGEGLIQNALKVDNGEIETIAHFKAAKFFNKDVDFILDIGGQDMKCLKIKNGVIDRIILNEACSSGCGSFLETFAKSLSMGIGDFIEEGIESKNPVDLGSRCTVFMNSKVKQAQKEGATVGDIASGLSYSVIKNALYKVIKIRNTDEIGEHIVVQGGTFYNDLVLRSFEKLIGKNVVRPNISGIMGAFGAALISREKYSNGYETTLLLNNELDNVKFDSEVARCNGCSNKCLLTINKFSDTETYITGNRCEKGAVLFGGKKENDREELVNLYKYKYDRLFGYKTLSKDDAKRGEIGIPRVLNMYEDYPFWFTFFTKLGFRVVLSARSSKKIYEKGMESIISDTVCYPAKLVHGHVMDLIEKGIKNIFYPSVVYENNEDVTADNYYNCPVVISYSEVIKNNLEELRTYNTNFMNPFLSMNDKGKLKKRLYEELKKYYPDLSKKEINLAVDAGTNEYISFKTEIQNMGEKTVEELKEKNLKGIVLSGRPYHLDPEINHGLPELINSLGMAVLTEDSVCQLAHLERPLRVVDQWVYHSRLYKAAEYVCENESLEIVQLNSFGCGLDAVTTDQVEEILNKKSKIYTVIKIDEGNNLGAAKIRLRSLKAAIEDRALSNQYIDVVKKSNVIQKNVKITKESTILMPQMVPIAFDLVEEALNSSGFDIVLIRDEDRSAIEEGLKYVNNDACYPAIVVVGQIIKALKSGKYDLSKTSVVMSQTGGGCRATNYIALLRKAVKDAGFEQVPVIALSVNGVEDNGMMSHFSLKLVSRLFMACIYGDLLMKVLYRVRPYEKVKGSANKLYKKWAEKCKKSLKNAKISEYKKNIYNIVKDFDSFEIVGQRKPRVGLVGEILVKFHPVANNNLVELLEEEGVEAVVPELLNFFTCFAYNAKFKHECLEGTLKSKWANNVVLSIISMYMRSYNKALRNSSRFSPAESIKTIAKSTESVVSLGNQTGEGWLLPGEMIELLEHNVNNIICMQPFGCLPNHIIGKGPIKELKRRYEDANIVPIDYDPSASEVNQINRIKLMLSKAFEMDNIESSNKNKTIDKIDKNNRINENFQFEDENEKNEENSCPVDVSM